MNAVYTNLPPLSDAQRGLVEAHLDWAVSGARKYARRYGRLLEFDDLVSAAQYALVIAAQRFDPSRGLSFKTYAMPWTESYLQRTLGDLRKAHGGKARSESGDAQQPLKRVAWPVDADGHLLDVFPAPAFDIAGERLRRQRVALVLACARTPRERAILIGRLQGASNQQIGERLGVSGSYVKNVWPELLERTQRRVQARNRPRFRQRSAA